MQPELQVAWRRRTRKGDVFLSGIAFRTRNRVFDWQIGIVGHAALPDEEREVARKDRPGANRSIEKRVKPIGLFYDFRGLMRSATSR